MELNASGLTPPEQLITLSDCGAKPSDSVSIERDLRYGSIATWLTIVLVVPALNVSSLLCSSQITI